MAMMHVLGMWCMLGCLDCFERACNVRPDRLSVPAHEMLQPSVLYRCVAHHCFRRASLGLHLPGNRHTAALHAGVLEEHKQGAEAETLYSIGETMASLPSRGASVFQNIQNGGRQTVNSVSKPALNATLAAKVNRNSRASSLKGCHAGQHCLVSSPCKWPHLHLCVSRVTLFQS